MFAHLQNMAKKPTKKQKKQATSKTKTPVKGWIWMALIALVFVFVYPYIFDKKVNLGGDNAGYYILGKAISTGQGYTDIHKLGNPAHNHFPPGYPVILGVVMFFTQSITALKIVNGLFLLGTALLLYSLLQRFTDSKPFAFVVATLLLFNFHLLSYGTILMSEVPFLFFSTLAMLLFVNANGEKPFYRNPNFYLLIIVSSFSFHIRTAGIALVAGFALYMLIERKFKMLGAYLVGFIALGIPWFLRGQSMGGSQYIKQLFLKNPYRPENGAMEIGDWFSRFGANFGRYLGKEIPNGVFPGVEVSYGEDGISNYLAGILIVAVSIFGIVKLKKYKWLIAGYLIGSFGILLLWPEVWFGIRFLLPLIPFILFLFVYGVYELLNLLAKKVTNKAMNPLLLLILGLFFIPQLKNLKEAADSPYQKKFKNYFEMAAWANSNLQEDAVVATRKPGLFYLFSGIKVTQIPYTADYNEYMDKMTEKQATHAVIDQLGYSQTGRFLYPFVQDNPEKFKVTHQISDPDTYLLEYNGALGYRGEWRVEENNGMYTHTKEGKGSFTYPNGAVVEGIWKDGKMISNE